MHPLVASRNDLSGLHRPSPRFKLQGDKQQISCGLLLKTVLALSTAFSGLNLLGQTSSRGEPTLAFAITCMPAKGTTPIDGRLLLLLSTDASEEPRFQINDSLKTQIVFGLDVEDLKPGQTRVIAATNAAVF